MAITKLLRIKEVKGGDPAKHLKNNIFYICNPQKTENGIYIGGNAVTNPETILQTMLLNKKAWGKEKGSQAFHYVISFPPTLDVKEDQALEIAEDFCKELFGESYYYCIAVHNDQAHMHAHVTFDSVSKIDGMKFHSPRGDWEKRIQPITDRVCKKYNLPTLEYDLENTVGVDHGAWEIREAQAEEKKSGERTSSRRYGWQDIVRDDIDECIEEAADYDSFISRLQERGYEVNDGKYLSLKPEGHERAIRTRRLGEEYTKDAIMNRINNKSENLISGYRTYGDPEFVRMEVRIKVRRYRKWKMSGMQKMFYRRWHNVYSIRHPAFRRKPFYVVEKELRELSRYADTISYMIRNDVRTEESARDRLDYLGSELQELKKAKKGNENSEGREYLKQQEMKLREEMKIVTGILEDCRTEVPRQEIDHQWIARREHHVKKKKNEMNKNKK